MWSSRGLQGAGSVEDKTPPDQLDAATPALPCRITGPRAFWSDGQFGVPASRVLYKAPQGPDPLSGETGGTGGTVGVQCPGPRKWETWAVRKQNPILLEGKRKLKNSWGKLIQNTHGFYLSKCSGRCIHSYKWVSVWEHVPL